MPPRMLAVPVPPTKDSGPLPLNTRTSLLALIVDGPDPPRMVEFVPDILMLLLTDPATIIASAPDELTVLLEPKPAIVLPSPVLMTFRSPMPPKMTSRV